jgi:deoxycytidylate deaminase
MMLPTYIQRYIEANILSQLSRYTTKHCTNNHVAMIFHGRKVLAIGQNRIQSRGRGKHSKTIHAEADAIRSLGDHQKLRGSRLVVIRIAPSGIINSAPCIACRSLIDKCVKTYGMIGCEHS